MQRLDRVEERIVGGAATGRRHIQKLRRHEHFSDSFSRKSKHVSIESSDSSSEESIIPTLRGFRAKYDWPGD